MQMDAADDAMDHHSSSSSNAQFPAAVVVKGKRRKRQRAAAPAASSASSVELSSSTTEEEEDMANCLILLAQGRALDDAAGRPVADKAASGRAGEFVYQCKTCHKCFPSFQALGGHRTSHKKPKTAVPSEDKKPDEEGVQIGANSSTSKPALATNNTSKQPRMHECSICGSEFSSGQALGGHMRRHRPITTAAEPSSEVKKERSSSNNAFNLDLNLPAPSDDNTPSPPPPSSFPYESQQPLVFSASALVDCHY
ncbi:hypothetical protein Cni_G22064 [Canna indica]|uniref:C2H2-type domain-containing protein n=1 Tax=Canna indica TaxID=4628 RepID=A0AAQ3KS14_9LILI|nr:hypothetical protein Cni_G22064 [Canna indica]